MDDGDVMTGLLRPERDVAHPGGPIAVPRNLLRDAVFARMLRSILRGDYRRGQRLRLDALADDMQVSRTPVREALVPLEAMRLVVVQRYVGVVIAPWTVGQMVERTRIARAMLIDPPSSCAPTDEPFDAVTLRDCLSEAGAFVELAVWVLRRSGAPVSADWLRSQQPVLDVFHTDDIARANGIDVAADWTSRMHLVKAARAAALADDVPRCAARLAALAELLIALPERFRSAGTA
ncbi:GntR family transcriptional regulator [Curtobacterium sp. MCBD17_021]|uniref:GntR family transcriptional regulator n=1 Tax=Curtobacterium sp. MCBD17_021 TaxID=2175665 RepID=UPI001C65131A|nr:GntR family transcriptional regulator [Curtobacterium sp. MCBD17_021]